VTVTFSPTLVLVILALLESEVLNKLPLIFLLSGVAKEIVGASLGSPTYLTSLGSICPLSGTKLPLTSMEPAMVEIVLSFPS